MHPRARSHAERRELEALRRRCTRLERGAIAAALSLVAFALMGQAAPDYTSSTVAAQQFLLKDANGRTRGEIGFTADGSARVVLCDVDGRNRVGMMVDADGGSSVTLLDGEGRAPIAFYASPEGVANVAVRPAPGRRVEQSDDRTNDPGVRAASASKAEAGEERF